MRDELKLIRYWLFSNTLIYTIYSLAGGDNTMFKVKEFKFVIIPIFLSLLSTLTEASINASKIVFVGDKTPKMFLNVIVDNVPCSGIDGKMYGVCKTTTDCLIANGKEIGRCANGEASCCQINVIPSSSPTRVTTITDASVTLISSGVANSNSVIEIPRRTNICQLKVNFLQTILERPSTDPLRWGECIRDVLTVSGTQSFPSESFIVCGDLSGQHMYLSYGLTSATPSDKIIITIKTVSSSTKYAINVVQLPCNSPDIVPDHCLQQWTGDTGRVRTFGFPYQLNNQNYKICTAVKAGVTAVEWKECQSAGARSKPFFITGVEDNGVPVPPQTGNILCSYDHIQLGSGGQLTSDKLCGGGFTKTVVAGSGGLISVYFDSDEIGHAVVITNLPPSLKCSDIQFPVHNCRSVTSGGEPACVCTLDAVFPIQISIPIEISESCPRIEGYECSKETPIRCGCIQFYDEADDANTGFCLEYTNIF